LTAKKPGKTFANIVQLMSIVRKMIVWCIKDLEIHQQFRSKLNPRGADGGSHKKMQTAIYRLCAVSAVADCDGMKIFALVADPICVQPTQKIDFIKRRLL
jgi:hypothetical protein